MLLRVTVDVLGRVAVMAAADVEATDKPRINDRARTCFATGRIIVFGGNGRYGAMNEMVVPFCCCFKRWFRFVFRIRFRFLIALAMASLHVTELQY